MEHHNVVSDPDKKQKLNFYFLYYIFLCFYFIYNYSPIKKQQLYEKKMYYL